MTKTYVRQWYPGSFFSEDTIKPSDHRDPNRFTPDKGAYAFQFMDRQEIVSDGETLHGPWRNESPTYYPGGTIFAPDEIRKWTDRDYSILISNIENNGYKAAIKTRRGTFQMFEEGKTICI